MTIKTFSLGLVIALIAAIFAAILTVLGTHLLSQDDSKLSAISNFFSSSEESPVEFVEIKNVVVTLKSHGDSERYLLLELALATHSASDTVRAEELSPAIRGATVNLLSSMEYDTVRAMSVELLHDKLMQAYEERFQSLNTRMPFKDVIISKMVFQ
ncbi:flagellar basal body-associated FliL family protein [Enterobacter huaxiensis]|jgi:flagellar FliL protein|uniref:Flagellar protein FliL n=1 Tax=Enterobacter huaxiensis TaxID=2494702 RepID=A0A428LHH4_9ENTR|nr:flagellar basal body-associated FliL family protein [Enterobacter huaxiensis]MCS5451977.1 flagellar basal body-associated FliL family protein [Enterobacter huaxiensis]MEB7544967.1 flagellar basal body-associated FliL family protein [Enterobacter huaxiensis]MEB7583218.1 flagellar basal body-associated FliL family protein [Enterobacter huaxiensis]MEB7665383.1 flagellar basal body-associated FliL family protein [Enterobacter huaxiensis]RSK63457.1 flagellar basal body-associated FliL family pro